jgi:hypothetical protein
MHKIFGIRHHGPGSAQRLLRALEQWQPDCVLIELPEDCTPALKWISHTDLTPPVALLLYNPQELQQASFLPFAVFSPEWQALHYAQRAGIPARAMDLPMAQSFALRESATELPLLPLDAAPDAELLQMLRDPMHYLATLAGYEDSERWWEHTFETYTDDEAVFEAILEMMTALRQEGLRLESTETLLREAQMRKTIRQAQKEGFQKIAVVCGAWHGPALADLVKYPTKNDNTLLRGLKKVKTRCTWIPWSYERLAFQSGYAAGVLSPAWYELLFLHPAEQGVRWLIRVAQLLRQKHLDASAAHVQEAIRLADALAALRYRTTTGIGELEEAALAVFGGGDSAPLKLIQQELVIGKVRGNVPAQVIGIPLQEDFEEGVKSAGLNKIYRSAAHSEEPKKLDLRIPANLRASHLLHRLHILGIAWAEVVPVSDKVKGSFHELWQFQDWTPEFIIRLIEMGMWGNTLAEAALHYILHLVEQEDNLGLLLQRFGEVLKADLPVAIGPMTKRLQELGAQTRDVFSLLETLAPLANILRYGNTRQTDALAVRELLDQLLPRVCIGLAAATRNLDDEPARDFFRLLLEGNRAVALLHEKEASAQWNQALGGVVKTPGAHPLLAGICTRMLLDKTELSPEQAGITLSAALSKASGATDAALWLEGFLHGSGQLLLFTPALWDMLNVWLIALPYEVFREALPVLRRTFSKFTAPERQEMLNFAKGNPKTKRTTHFAFDPERAQKVNPILGQLLGLRNG